MTLTHPHLAGRVLGTPLAIHPGKLQAVLGAVGAQIDVAAVSSAFEATDQGDDEGLLNGIKTISIHGSLASRTLGVSALSGLASLERLTATFRKAAADDRVRGVLLDINSPGGEVAGLFEATEALRQLASRKPVVACANHLAASAGYLLASAAREVFVSLAGTVGSVGVVAVHVDESERDRQEGRRYTFVHAGDRKLDYSAHAPLADRAKAQLKAEVDRIHGLFVARVAEYRKLKVETVMATQAAVFHGPAAVAAGLADEVGTLADARAALVLKL